MPIERIFSETSDRARHSLDTQKPTTGRYAVMIDADVLATLFHNQLSQLSSANAYHGLPFVKPGDELIQGATGDRLPSRLIPRLSTEPTAALSETGIVQAPFRLVDRNRVVATATYNALRPLPQSAHDYRSWKHCRGTRDAFAHGTDPAGSPGHRDPPVLRPFRLSDAHLRAKFDSPNSTTTLLAKRPTSKAVRFRATSRKFPRRAPLKKSASRELTSTPTARRAKATLAPNTHCSTSVRIAPIDPNSLPEDSPQPIFLSSDPMHEPRISS